MKAWEVLTGESQHSSNNKLFQMFKIVFITISVYGTLVAKWDMLIGAIRPKFWEVLKLLI